MKKMIRLICLMLAIGMMATVAVSASNSTGIPYQSYGYDAYGDTRPAPAGYLPEGNVELSLPLNAPSDLYYDRNGTVYLLDSGNGRILLLDTDWRLIRSLDAFVDAHSGEALSIEGAQGLTVTADGTLYVADTARQRIIISDPQGHVSRIITKPDTGMLDEETACNYIKVMVDQSGRIYALADDINIGILLFDSDGSFMKFFGSNEVVRTADVISKYLRRRFMSQVQLDATIQYTPTNIGGFDMDSDGFIYTASKSSSSTAENGMVRRLNSKGVNVLDNGNDLVFGDTDWDRNTLVTTATRFSDVRVDEEKFLFLLDSSRGRVFVYSEQGILLTEFGGYGNQTGLFANPSAVEVINDNVYVLDSEKNCVHAFSPTQYVELYRTAINRINTSQYEGSMEIWEQLLEMNTNNDIAYYGMGQVYDAAGQYKAAMDCFRKSSDRRAYSESFREYRKEVMKDHFLPILFAALLAAALLIAGVVILRRAMRKPEGATYSKWESKYTFPFYTLAHPADGFSQFRSREIMSYRVTAVLLIAFFAIRVMEFFCLGFPFNPYRASDFNLAISFLQTFGLFILFIISNYAICTLIEGKGKLKELIVMTAYSLVPFMLTQIVRILLSQVFTLQEEAFLNLVSVIGIMWSGVLLFVGLGTIHQFSFKKTIASAVLTIAGMAVIIFLGILFYSLLSQLFTFIQSLIMEASLR